MHEERLSRRMAEGEELFKEGDVADCAYVVDVGRLEVSVHRDGRRHVLAEVGPGSLIGEMALLDSGTRTASVRALEASSLHRLERDHLEEHLHTADPLVRHMLELLIGRYRDVVRRLDGIARPQGLSTVGGVSGARYRSLAIQRLRVEQDLKEALSRDQFVLHYQPIMRLGDQAVAGFEALIRWLHPVRGLVSPDDFIPAAEESGLIAEMGHWVIRTAVAALAQMDIHSGSSAEPLFMAVNLSGRQFADPQLVSVLRDALAEHRIAPDRLRLEITESSLLDRIDEAAGLMRQCTDLGMKLAVDDFGTGYSALSYLYRLPVSSVKLARPFIDDLAQYPESAKIIGAMSKLARELQMDIMAEGIEQAQQAATVRALGVDYGQGFHYAAALPLMVASGFVRRSLEADGQAQPLIAQLRSGR